MGVYKRERHGKKRWIADITVNKRRYIRTFDYTPEGRVKAEEFLAEKTKVRKFRDSFKATRLTCDRTKKVIGLYLTYLENKKGTKISLIFYRRRPIDGKVINIKRVVNDVEELNTKYHEIIQLAREGLGTTPDQMVGSRRDIKRFLWEIENQFLEMQQGLDTLK